MNATHSLSVCAVSVFALGLVSATTSAGDLEPPPGPVTPTFKTLDQVEPRIPINLDTTPGDANSLYKITSPGSYYLTGNITGEADKHGISITTGDVTLDLNGFSLIGVEDSLDGIRTTSEKMNLCIRNGAVRGWGDDGIAVLADNFIYEDLRIALCGGGGIINSAGSFDGIVRRVCVFNVGMNSSAFSQDGIHVGDSAIVESCTVRGARGDGIRASDDAIVRGCTVYNVDESGIRATQRTLVEGCRVSYCDQYGIRLSTDAEVVRSTVSHCGFTSLDGAGIYAQSSGCRIEGNHVMSCDNVGIRTGASGCLVIRNSTGGNGTNHDFATGTLFGPIVTAGTILTDEHPHANYSW